MPIFIQVKFTNSLVPKRVTESLLGLKKKLLKVIYLCEQAAESLLFLKVHSKSFFCLLYGEKSYQS
jgi:hypothetical protein